MACCGGSEEAAELFVWNWGKGSRTTVLKGHAGKVHQCCFAPNSRLASAGSDGTAVRVWDAVTKACLTLYSYAFGGPVRCIAAQPSGLLAVRGGQRLEPPRAAPGGAGFQQSFKKSRPTSR